MIKLLTENKTLFITRAKFGFTILFVYVTLFELVLPVNKILPRPTLLWESLLSVWKDYNLIFELSVTTLVVYSSIIIGYLLVWLTRIPILKLLSYFGDGFSNIRIFRYFPAFFYAVIFAFWFPASITAEFFFALVAVTFYMIVSIKENLEIITDSHLVVANNLKISGKKLFGEIFWKNLQPAVFNSILKIHYFVWILILVFEYVGDYAGLGHVYNQALVYNDFAGLFSLAIYIALLIWFGDSVIKFTKSKIIYWEN